MPPTAGSSTAEADHPVLYLDLGHPESLLAAERALQVMPVATEWIPVHLGIPAHVSLEALRVVAAERDLQPVRTASTVPWDAEQANLAATFAKSTGRMVAFTQAALRQAYNGARDLSNLDNVLIAGSACELHPRSVLKALGTKGTRRTLDEATALARERGVTRAPSVWALGRLFEGDAGLDAAAAHLREHGAVPDQEPEEADVVELLTREEPPPLARHPPAMSAARDLAVVHRRASRLPAFLQPEPGVDQVEVVEVASGEVVLFWDVPAPEAKRWVAELRHDLHRLGTEELLGHWGAR